MLTLPIHPKQKLTQNESLISKKPKAIKLPEKKKKKRRKSSQPWDVQIRIPKAVTKKNGEKEIIDKLDFIAENVEWPIKT